jgi:hypothetical protein
VDDGYERVVRERLRHWRQNKKNHGREED